MLGIALSYYKKPLNFVPVHQNNKPVKSVKLNEVFNKKYKEFTEEYYGEKVNLENIMHQIPIRSYDRVEFEEVCKIHASSVIMMDSSVEELFEKNIDYRLIRKIDSSIWRWSHVRAKWNDTVSAYNCIRNFKLDNPDFKIRLDYTTGFNEKGWSEYTCTFLDGVLAFLIYYKGEHVMTLGFSVVGNRKILIQQVQLKKRTGNRWLYKLPSSYLEYVLEMFEKAFPKYKMYIVDSLEVAKTHLANYETLLKKAENNLAKYKNRQTTCQDVIKSFEEDIKTYTEKVAHAQKDFPRLSVFYNNTGAFKRTGKQLKHNCFTFHQIERV